MRPPLVWISVAFGAGLWAGLGSLGAWGAGMWAVGASVLIGALSVARQAPVGAAIGLMGVAGLLWGAAAGRGQDATCAGRGTAGGKGGGGAGGGGRGGGGVGRLAGPAPAGGGLVEARVESGRCGGALSIRWPACYPAGGGTLWLVAGRWIGDARRGVLVARRVRQLEGEAQGRGALRDRLARRTTELFGARAPLVAALVFAPNAALDPDVRERYARSGLAHILSISGLHVGFLAAWLALILRRLGLSPGARAGAAASLLVAYLWLLAFPAPATRAAIMLVADQVARLRQRVAAPRGVIALSALVVLAVPGLAMALALSWIATALAHLLAAGAGLGLALLDAVARLAASVPGGHVIMIAGWRSALVWTGVAAAAWWLWNSPRRRWLMAARCAFVLTLFCWTSFLDAVPLDGVSLDACRCLTVHFLDVGQGDAAALRTPGGRWVVVDGGPRTPESDAGRRGVIPFLRRRGASRLALVGATHGDAEHPGGLPAARRTAPPAGAVGAVELLKVGHHGSRSATSDAWLTELGPREAVISVGRRNHYGHPAPEVLARLARHGVAILRTDERGTITFSTDGHGGRVRSHHD